MSLILCITFLVVSAIAGGKVIYHSDKNIITIYLLVLNVFSLLSIYTYNELFIGNTSKWRVNFIAVPLFLLLIYSAFQCMPFGGLKFTHLHNILIFMFYVQLLFWSGTIKRANN